MLPRYPFVKHTMARTGGTSKGNPPESVVRSASAKPHKGPVRDGVGANSWKGNGHCHRGPQMWGMLLRLAPVVYEGLGRCFAGLDLYRARCDVAVRR